MIFTFGNSSANKLKTVRVELRESCELALSWQIYDFTIIWGWRGEDIQNQAFLSGNSKKKWPYSKHNITDSQGNPASDAVDFGPWCGLPDGKMGIPWKDTHAFAVVGGIILAAGAQLGYELIYGGDWDMDGTTTDQNLMDWGHMQYKGRLK